MEDRLTTGKAHSLLSGLGQLSDLKLDQELESRLAAIEAKVGK